MANNYEQMTITSLKRLAREKGKTGYSKLNKSEVIKKNSENRRHLESLLEKSGDNRRKRGVYGDTLSLIRPSYFKDWERSEAKY